MDIQHVLSWLGTIATIVGLALAVARKIRLIVVQINNLWVAYQNNARRINIMWRFHLTRGTAEATNRGLAVSIANANDPYAVELHPKVRAAYEPIAAILRDWWHTLGGSMTVEDQVQHIEETHGDWLVRNICVPFSISNGACLIMARAVAMG